MNVMLYHVIYKIHWWIYQTLSFLTYHVSWHHLTSIPHPNNFLNCTHIYSDRNTSPNPITTYINCYYSTGLISTRLSKMTSPSPHLNSPHLKSTHLLWNNFTSIHHISLEQLISYNLNFNYFTSHLISSHLISSQLNMTHPIITRLTSTQFDSPQLNSDLIILTISHYRTLTYLITWVYHISLMW
jgi:hypothetical protein